MSKSKVYFTVVLAVLILLLSPFNYVKAVEEEEENAEEEESTNVDKGKGKVRMKLL